MKKIILMMFMIFGTSMLFAQFPRFKFLQIQKDTTAGSILISSFSDSNMVYSRDFFINELDSSLILFGDTIALKNSISVFTDNTITGNGLTGSPLRVDTSVIATQGDLSDYVTVAGTQTITGAKTFSADVEIDGKLDINSGSNNIFIGTNSGNYTSGGTNTVLGVNSLQDNSSGNGNLAFGYQSLRYNSTGNYNVGLGDGALFNNISGNFNMAIGLESLYNTKASSNTSIGFQSLYSNVNGGGNIAIGRDAGRYITAYSANTKTDNSVYLGYLAKAADTAQINQIVIGYDATGLGTNSVVLGNSAITKTRLQGDVGIGTDSPSKKLDVVGDVEINGKLDLSVNTNSIYIGSNAGAGTGNLNVGIGANTLSSVTTGFQNVAIGVNALANITSTSNNMAVGTSALNVNQGEQNVAIGVSALLFDSTGSYNTVNGYQVLYNNNGGNNNVALGHRAGRYFASGSQALTKIDNSVLVGYDARPQLDSQSNQIVIGYQARGLGDSTVVLGNSSIKTTRLQGDVGIGTDSPSEKLHVVGNSKISGNNTASQHISINQSSGVDTRISWSSTPAGVIGTISNHPLELYSNSYPRAILSTNGNFGIGSFFTPQNKLDVKGSAVIGATYSGTNIAPTNGLLVEGNVGIGKTDPTYKLDVAGNTRSDNVIIGADVTYGGTYRSLSFGYNGDGNNRIFATHDSADGMYFAAATGRGFTFRPNGGTANSVVINSAGNVGIGVTPSAWSLGKAFEINSAGNNIWSYSNDNIYLNQNSYYNSGFKYGTSGTAAQYILFQGQHLWYNAPSGTANDPITFTQAMTLDTSGRLGIGTTSPSAKLDVVGNTELNGALTQSGGDVNFDSGTFFVDEGLNRVGIGTSTPTNSLSVAEAGANAEISINALGIRRSTLIFKSEGSDMWYVGRGDKDVLNDSTFFIGNFVGSVNNAGGASAKFVINNIGNVGIGTSTPQGPLSVAGSIHLLDVNQSSFTDNNIYVYNDSDAGSTGGTTDAEFGFYVAKKGSSSNAEGPNFVMRGNDYTRNANQRGAVFLSAGTVTSPTGFDGTINFYTNSQLKMQIEADGDVVISSLGNGSSSQEIGVDLNGKLIPYSSDERLKQKTNDELNAIAKIKSLNPLYYKWLDFESMGTKEYFGFFAQDIQNVMPSAVYNVGQTDYYGYDKTAIIALNTKAIQEQQSIIESQESKIQTLESTIETLQQQMQDLINRMIIMENQ